MILNDKGIDDRYSGYEPATAEEVKEAEAALRLRDAADWDEVEHPREPAGSPEGGKFVNKGSSEASVKAGFPSDSEPRVAGAIRDKAAWDAALDDFKRYKEQDSAIGSAVYDYQSRTYQEINQSLHEGKATAEARELKAILKEYGDLDASILTYRGTGFSREQDSKFVVGKTVRLPGFQSTSPDIGVASQFGRVILEIKAIRGIAIGGSERELLLPHGDRYKVVGRRTVEADLTAGHSTLVTREKIEIIQLEQKP